MMGSKTRFIEILMTCSRNKMEAIHGCTGTSSAFSISDVDILSGISTVAMSEE